MYWVVSEIIGIYCFVEDYCGLVSFHSVFWKLQLDNLIQFNACLFDTLGLLWMYDIFIIKMVLYDIIKGIYKAKWTAFIILNV